MKRKRRALRTKKIVKQEEKKEGRIKKSSKDVLPVMDMSTKEVKIQNVQENQVKTYKTITKIPENAKRLCINKFKIEEKEGRREKVKIGEFFIYEHAESDQEESQEDDQAVSLEICRGVDQTKEILVEKKEERDRNFNIFDSAISLDSKNKIFFSNKDQLKEGLFNKNKEVNANNIFQYNASSIKSRVGVYEELNNYNFTDINKTQFSNENFQKNISLNLKDQLHNDGFESTQILHKGNDFEPQEKNTQIIFEGQLNNTAFQGEPSKTAEIFNVLRPQIIEEENLFQKEDDSFNFQLSNEYLNYCKENNITPRNKKPLTKPCNICGNSHLEKYEIMKFTTFSDFLKILYKSINLSPNESYLTIQTESNFINALISNRKYLEDPLHVEKLKRDFSKIKEDFQNGTIKQENNFKRTKRICHVCLSEKLSQENGMNDLLDSVIEEDEKAELDLVKKEEILRNINTFMIPIQKIKQEEEGENDAERKFFNIFDYIFGKKKFNSEVMKLAVSSSNNSSDDSSIRNCKNAPRESKFSMPRSSKEISQFNNLKFLNDMSKNQEKLKLNPKKFKEVEPEKFYSLLAKAVFQYSTFQSLSTYNNLIINISFFLLEQYLTEYSEIISKREESALIIKESLEKIQNSLPQSQNEINNYEDRFNFLNKISNDSSNTIDSLHKQNSESSKLLCILKDVLADMKTQCANISGIQSTD